jgi:hypothetical protein
MERYAQVKCGAHRVARSAADPMRSIPAVEFSGSAIKFGLTVVPP